MQITAEPIIYGLIFVGVLVLLDKTTPAIALSILVVAVLSRKQQ